MLKFLWQLFVVGFPEDKCEHVWDTIKEANSVSEDKKVLLATVYTMRCVKCGDYKTVTIDYTN